MSKNKKIFSKPDDSIPSPDQILNYLNEDSIPLSEEGGAMDKKISRKNKKERQEEESELSASFQSSMDISPEETIDPPTLEKELNKSISFQPAAFPSGPSKKKGSVKPDNQNKTKHDLEKKMLESSLIGDAVEGFSLLKNKEKARNIIDDINDTISQKSSKKDRWVIYKRAAALALLFLLFGGGFLYFNDSLNESSVAVIPFEEKNKTENKSDEIKGAIDSDKNSVSDIAIKTPKKGLDEKSSKVPSVPSEKPISSDAYIQEEELSKSVDKTEIEINSPKASGSSRLGNLSNEEIQAPSPGVAKDDKAMKETTPVMEPSFSRVEMQESKKIKSKKEEEFSKNMSDHDMVSENVIPERTKGNKVMIGVDKGIELYNEAKYKEASDIFQNVVEIQPQNQIGLYYNGLAYYRLNELDLALKNFPLVIQKSRYYYDAQWYMSEIYLIKKETEKAKVILKKLSRPDNPYWEKAIIELKKIQ